MSEPQDTKEAAGDWPDSIAALARRVDAHMRLHYRVSLFDLEQTDTPGYWRDKEPKMHPGHPLHSCLGCGGPFRATYTYFDPPRVGGRFASPTRTWAALRANS
jgi:hypothetical protein